MESDPPPRLAERMLRCFSLVSARPAPPGQAQLSELAATDSEIVSECGSAAGLRCPLLCEEGWLCAQETLAEHPLKRTDGVVTRAEVF